MIRDLTDKLRHYQMELKNSIYQGWHDGFRNILAVLPTGGGKARTLSVLAYELAYHQTMPVTIMVHRKELVTQLCMTLAELDIPHNIIAQRATINNIVEAERRAHKKSYYDHRAMITVVSVDTFNARIEKYREWAEKQLVCLIDEAAHVLKNNKWGKAAAHLPNALVVGFTATPQRLDKKGLGRHAFGIFDHMVQGPEVKWLIENGFLSKYKIVVPKSDYREHLKDDGSTTNDYTAQARAYASMHSHIVGDVVENYIKWADGKQAIVFADCVEAAEKMERTFLERGISAKLLTAETPDRERVNSVFEYRDGKIKVLINIDLFDEGFDVPGIYCVIMARPTKSVSKFRQICGRGLRVIKGKEHAIIIDHVGNIKEHGLPCNRRAWSLDNTVRRRDTTNLLRTCSNTACNAPYDRFLTECPHCGSEAITNSRSGGMSVREALEVVDGDLALLDPEMLRAMEAEVALEDPAETQRRVTAVAGEIAGKAALRKQKERIETQHKLAQVIALWAGHQKEYYNLSDRQINKKFYITYDKTITVALSEAKAEMLATKNFIEQDLGIK